MFVNNELNNSNSCILMIALYKSEIASIRLPLDYLPVLEMLIGVCLILAQSTSAYCMRQNTLTQFFIDYKLKHLCATFSIDPGKVLALVRIVYSRMKKKFFRIFCC